MLSLLYGTGLALESAHSSACRTGTTQWQTYSLSDPNILISAYEELRYSLDSCIVSTVILIVSGTATVGTTLVFCDCCT
jgi:hypothetical protein